MFRMPEDEYDHQYYEKGLGFSKDYNREQQVTKDHAQPLIRQLADHLVIRFKTPASGRINFIRPADKSLDKSYPLQNGEDNRTIIALNGIKPGQWQLVLDWQNNGKQYLYQQEIYLQ